MLRGKTSQAVYSPLKLTKFHSTSAKTDWLDSHNMSNLLWSHFSVNELLSCKSRCNVKKKNKCP